MLKAVAQALWKNKFNAAIGGYVGVSTYKDDREAGAGTMSSLAHAGLEAALPLINLPAYFAYTAATVLPEATYKGYTAADQYKRKLAAEASNYAFVNARFNDTDQTYTMRQRGMEIARRGRYNTQQAMLGNEAKYMMK